MRHLSGIRTAIELKPCVMSDTPFVHLDHVQLAMRYGEADRGCADDDGYIRRLSDLGARVVPDETRC
jgi:hypothetical protein